MAIAPIEYVDEDKFPRSARKLLNRVASLWDRSFEVRFTEDLSPDSAKVEQSDDRFVILIPRGGGAGTNIVAPWTVFFRKNNGQLQRGIYKQSPVQFTIKHNDLSYPDNVLNNNDPSKATTGWVNTADGDFIWDKINFTYAATDDPFGIDTHSLKSTSAGNTFISESLYIDNNPSGDPQYVQFGLEMPVALVQVVNGFPSVKVPYVRNVQRLVSAGAVPSLPSAGGTDNRNIDGVFYVV